MITAIDPTGIRPLHPARNCRLLTHLAADMRDNGWQGRPLLVIGRGSDYLAWTGSHRLAAAVEAQLSTVPCYVLPEEALTRNGFDAERGHVEDYERLQILKQVGDETALHIMWQENRS